MLYRMHCQCEDMKGYTDFSLRKTNVVFTEDKPITIQYFNKYLESIGMVLFCFHFMRHHDGNFRIFSSFLPKLQANIYSLALKFYTASIYNIDFEICEVLMTI